MRLLLTFFILITVNLFGQDNPRTKTINDALGLWKFKPFYEKFDDGQKAIMPIWVVMEINFSEQGHFKFLLNDSTTQEGKWDISDDGKTLLLTERMQTPEHYEELLPLNFPIRTKKGKYIKLVFKAEGKDKEIEFRPAK